MKNQDNKQNQINTNNNKLFFRYAIYILLLLVGMVAMFYAGIFVAKKLSNSQVTSSNKAKSTVITQKQNSTNKNESSKNTEQQKTKEKTKQQKQSKTKIKTKQAKQKKEKTKTVHIGSTGCMIFHDKIQKSHKIAEDTYDFSPIFKHIKDTYSKYDFMTCEYEGAVSNNSLGYKGYPEFHCPSNTVLSIKNSGIDLQMCATNHIFDTGSIGIDLTMNAFENNKASYTGIRRNESNKNYFIKDIKGIKVGFIDYTFGKSSSINNHEMDKDSINKVNIMDLDNLKNFYSEIESSITNMKKEGAEFIFANIHWGTEYKIVQNNEQEEIAKELSNLGVNALIGGHPHCVQPIDIIESSDKQNKMFVIYSTGNALSNQIKSEMSGIMETGHTEDSVIVDIALTKEKKQVSISKVNAIPTWVYRSKQKKENIYDYYILPLNDIDNLEKKVGINGIKEKAQESYNRTMNILKDGLNKANKVYEKNK